MPLNRTDVDPEQKNIVWLLQLMDLKLGMVNIMNKF